MMQPQPAGSLDFNVLSARIRRLLTFDATVFDEVRMDRAATVPALIVVATAIFLYGIGGWLWWVFSDPDEIYGGTGEVLLKSAIFGSIIALIFWAAWVGLTYVMLSQVFRARVDLNDLIRVMGFAAAPLGLGVLMFVPEVDFGVALTALALMFGTNVIAVQAVTDAAAGRVVAATGAGFLLWAVMLGLFVGDENAYAPGIFIFDMAVELIQS